LMGMGWRHISYKFRQSDLTFGGQAVLLIFSEPRCPPRSSQCSGGQPTRPALAQCVGFVECQGAAGVAGQKQVIRQHPVPFFGISQLFSVQNFVCPWTRLAGDAGQGGVDLSQAGLFDDDANPLIAGLLTLVLQQRHQRLLQQVALPQKQVNIRVVPGEKLCKNNGLPSTYLAK